LRASEELLAHSPMRVSVGGAAACRGTQGFQAPARRTGRKRGPQGVSEIPVAVAIARRAGLDPATVWLHKFRATAATNWLRSKELGGKGWDIGFVRQQLGHADLQSIEHYITLVKNSEMAMREGVEAVNFLKISLD
jgi:integrase